MKVLFGILLLFLSCTWLAQAFARNPEMRTEINTARLVDLNVRVVVIGISPELVNTTYLKWNLPSIKFQQYLNPGVTTGARYRLNYEFIFPSREFEDSFAQYLKSIAKLEVFNNPFFETNLTNTFYPADLTENWLRYHQSDFYDGSVPAYTLVLANLSRTVPSVSSSQYSEYIKKSMSNFTPHYYNMTYYDSDLYFTLRRRWMTSWGGSGRLYFIDLSAGPSNVTKQLPLQWATKANNITFQTPYGSIWLTQYLSDWIYGAVEGLFAPDFIYPIGFAKKFIIDVLVIDNRTDLRIPAIDATLSPPRIKEELEKLLPLSEIEVKVRFINATSSKNLTNIIVTSTSPGKYGNISVIDARPVYNWLSAEGVGHLKDFFNITERTSELHIPVMAFVFTGEHQFGFTFKEDLSDDAESIWGVALGDVILISHSSHDLIRGNFTERRQPQRGFGLTNTIIHEVGHMLGLTHPFRIDPTQDFVASVMAYYPYEYGYSQFEKDSLLRGYTDSQLMAAKADLREVGPNLLNQELLLSIQRKLEVVERHYSEMSYAEALPVALKVRREAAFARWVTETISIFTTGSLAVFSVSSIVVLITFGPRYLRRKKFE